MRKCPFPHVHPATASDRHKRHPTRRKPSSPHPKRDDDKEHLEEDSEDRVLGKRHRHDAQERRCRPQHDGGADLPESVRHTHVLRHARVLTFIGAGARERSAFCDTYT